MYNIHIFYLYFLFRKIYVKIFYLGQMFKVLVPGEKFRILFRFSVHAPEHKTQARDSIRVPMISERQKRETFFWLKIINTFWHRWLGLIFDLLDLINTLILHDGAARRVKERDWTAARCKSAFRKKETAKSNGPTVNLHQRGLPRTRESSSGFELLAPLCLVLTMPLLVISRRCVLYFTLSIRFSSRDASRLYKIFFDDCNV